MSRPLCQALYSGLNQLAVGGRLIYYTDSMNPIENEAILYTVITQQRGRFDFLKCSLGNLNVQEFQTEVFSKTKYHGLFAVFVVSYFKAFAVMKAECLETQ
jgi:16S rRNA C967 or C1407 C5-methylase (RsmB/RsmF family)